MPDEYTQINLAEIEDVAPANGFADRWQARAARTALGAQETGVTHFRLRAGKRSPFVHRHASAEEIYVVLSGTGRLRLDDDFLGIGSLCRRGNAPQQSFRPDHSHLAQGLPNSGQSGILVCGALNIIKPNDRNILRDASACLPQCMNRSDGGNVVKSK